MKKQAGVKVVSKGSAKSKPKLTEPSRRSGHELAAYADGKLRGASILVGGRNDAKELADIWLLKPGNEQLAWAQVSLAKSSQSPLPRSEFSIATCGNGLYLFGGLKQDNREVSILNDLWRFEMNESCSTGRWSLVTEECPASERSGHASVSIGGDRFVLHGGDCMGPLGDMWMYDGTSNTWTEIASAAESKPCARFSHSIAYCSETRHVCLFGGLTAHVSEEDGEVFLQHLNDIWVLNTSSPDPCTWRWSMIELTQLAPSPRDAAAMMFVDENKVMVFGGYGLTEDIEIVDEIDNAHVMDVMDVAESVPIGDGDGDGDVELDGSDGIPMEGLKISDEEREEPDQESSEVLLNEEEGGNMREDDGDDNDNDNDDDDDEDDDDDYDDDDENEEANVVTTFLGDVWLVDISSRSAVEMDDEAVLLVPPGRDDNGVRKGAKLVVNPATQKVHCFGGFDGERHHGLSVGISMPGIIPLGGMSLSGPQSKGAVNGESETPVKLPGVAP